MIVKEKDACLHDCPYKLSADMIYKSCIGQQCMGCRWATEDNPDWVPPNMMMRVDPRKDHMFIRSKTHGYCGMAGQA